MQSLPLIRTKPLLRLQKVVSATMSTNVKTATDSDPKITLYTNHGCPWAHRAHIAIKEIGLPYDEVIIDLTKPREQWYLDMNPVSCP